MEGAKRVLVVDDEDDVRAVISCALAEAGWETLEASEGEVAIQVAASEMPDLVVLDVRMGTMSGFDVFNALRTNPKTAHLPVIFLSSVNDYELGAPHTPESIGSEFGVEPPQAFIEKPVDTATLLSAVARICG